MPGKGFEVSAREEEALRAAVEAFIDFAREHRVKAIVLAGASAKILRGLVGEAWRNRFGEKPPPFFSLNALLASGHAQRLRGEPVLLADESAWSGETIRAAEQRLHRAGFSRVYPAVVAAPEYFSGYAATRGEWKEGLVFCGAKDTRLAQRTLRGFRHALLRRALWRRRRRRWRLARAPPGSVSVPLGELRERYRVFRAIGRRIR